MSGIHNDTHVLICLKGNQCKAGVAKVKLALWWMIYMDRTKFHVPTTLRILKALMLIFHCQISNQVKQVIDKKLQVADMTLNQ